ncbi:MAG: transglutaminase family protein [Methanobrevibacter sp.]|jgi:hypothetical protein|nr:transglutaminase family protein [Candidatus Methanoflexus mossambicus]
MLILDLFNKQFNFRKSTLFSIVLSCEILIFIFFSTLTTVVAVDNNVNALNDNANSINIDNINNMNNNMNNNINNNINSINSINNNSNGINSNINNNSNEINKNNNKNSDNKNKNNNNANSSLNSINDIKHKTISQKEVYNVAKKYYSSINYYRNIPNNFKVSKNFSLNRNEFYFVLSTYIVKKYKHDNSNIKIKYGIKSPKSIYVSTLKGKISSSKYYNFVIENINNIKKYNSPKSYNYYSAIFGCLYIITKSKNKKLPNSINVYLPKNDMINHNGQSVLLQSKFTGGKTSKYLGHSSRTPSNNPEIIKIAKTVIKYCKTTREKAKKLFDWLKDKTDYEFYYGTRYGGLKTIKSGKGNCVDLSRAYISLLRAVKIPARFVYTNSKFVISKSYIPHVWVQVLINKVWIPADLSNSDNSLGSIVNWTPYGSKIYGYYNEYPR